jgi:hypothetical protein
MKIIDILKDARSYVDRYDVKDAIKISIHKNLGKLVVNAELKKNIPELGNDLEYLISLYNNSDKHYES